MKYVPKYKKSRIYARIVIVKANEMEKSLAVSSKCSLLNEPKPCYLWMTISPRGSS